MFTKYLLFPYYAALKFRHFLYDTGRRKSWKCEAPAVCIGNITAGGTGKTPHTEMLLRLLIASEEWGGRHLAVLSRGYRRRSRGFQQVDLDSSADFAGDEPLQIKKKFPVVTVAVDRRRVEGCRFLCHPETLRTLKKGRKCRNKDFPPADLLILDDAFQHRALRADLRIVLIDYNRPVETDELLPFGRLRDLPERLEQADILIVTKCPHYIDDWEREWWTRALGLTDFDAATFAGRNRAGRRVSLFFTTVNYRPMEPVYAEGDRRYVYSKKLVLFTGIAKDTPLKRYLSDSYRIVRHFRFGDHHRYRGSDLARIRAASEEHNTAVVVTTEKDSQRLLDCRKVPEALRAKLFQVPIETGFLSEGERRGFVRTILSALDAFRPESGRIPREEAGKRP